MKRKIEVLLLLLIGVFILFKRYEIYYFFQGTVYLRPNESLKLEVKPRFNQVEYYSVLYIESDEEILLKLEGRNVWSEFTYGQTETYIGEIGYRYYITEQLIKKYNSNMDSGSIVKTGYKDTSIDRDGIIVPLKGKRRYGATEDHDYTITITNLSDKPVTFSARVDNH